MGPTPLGANSKVGRVAKERREKRTKRKIRTEEKKKRGSPRMGRSKLCTSKWGPPFHVYSETKNSDLRELFKRGSRPMQRDFQAKMNSKNGRLLLAKEFKMETS